MVFAAELDSLCVGVGLDTLEQEALWEGQGGTMNTFQLNEKGDFGDPAVLPGLSVPGCLHCQGGETGKSWKQTKIADLPFLPPQCVVEIEGVPTWCAAFCVRIRKIPKTGPSRAVWWCRKFPAGGGTGFFTTIVEGIHKNHGIFQGTLDGKNTILVTGQEGIFQLEIPAGLDDPWSYTKLMDQETSDCTVLDVDEDGEDEIIAIEKFHGKRVVVYKRQAGIWKQVYTYPVEFGHAIWSGTIFPGPPS